MLRLIDHFRPAWASVHHVLLVAHVLLFAFVMLLAVDRQGRPHLLTAVAVGQLETVAPLTCNGSAALCTRRVDEVTFAATHNSMSAASDGWLWPNQAEGIREQLQAGVRGFLIDTHYWEAPGRAGYYLRDVPAGQRAAFLARMFQWHPNEVYLCHRICAAGAVRLVDALREFNRFLDDHPGEVLILDIEDHVSPADTERAFRASGLLDRVYARQAGDPWPTLGELVARGRPVIVQAEHRGSANQWYGPLYREAWDTSYAVATPDGFTCEPARGRAAHGLLLLNHWVVAGAPRIEDARAVNTASSLLAHARDCVERYAKVPNLVAVDFASVGDLLSAVATLNGLASADTASR